MNRTETESKQRWALKSAHQHLPPSERKKLLHTHTQPWGHLASPPRPLEVP